MEEWQTLARKAEEDAERLFPKLSASSETNRLRQGKIEMLEAHLRQRPRNMEALAMLVVLKQERCKDVAALFE